MNWQRGRVFRARARSGAEGVLRAHAQAAYRTSSCADCRALLTKRLQLIYHCLAGPCHSAALHSCRSANEHSRVQKALALDLHRAAIAVSAVAVLQGPSDLLQHGQLFRLCQQAASALKPVCPGRGAHCCRCTRMHEASLGCWLHVRELCEQTVLVSRCLHLSDCQSDNVR